MNKVKIELIHDLVCSWCAIGYQHLTDAANELHIEVDVTYLPHQLNPDMQSDGMDIREYFKLAHGWSDKKHDQYRENLIAKAEGAGVNIDFRYRTRYFNTHLAHRLLAEAHTEGVARNLHETLLSAYHAYGLNISAPNVLAELASRVGLSNGATKKALDLTQSSLLYNEALSRRSEFNTATVPAWVVNGKELIVGSNSKAFFKSYLQNPSNFQTKGRAS